MPFIFLQQIFLLQVLYTEAFFGKEQTLTWSGGAEKHRGNPRAPGISVPSCQDMVYCSRGGWCWSFVDNVSPRFLRRGALLSIQNAYILELTTPTWHYLSLQDISAPLISTIIHRKAVVRGIKPEGDKVGRHGSHMSETAVIHKPLFLSSLKPSQTGPSPFPFCLSSPSVCLSPPLSLLALCVSPPSLPQQNYRGLLVVKSVFLQPGISTGQHSVRTLRSLCLPYNSHAHVRARCLHHHSWNDPDWASLALWRADGPFF